MHSPDHHNADPAPFELKLEEVHLRILQTTDIHVNLLPYNYFTDSHDPKVGLSQLSGLIAKARTQAPNTLLLDTGDFLQGTPLGDLFVEKNPSGGPGHPAIAMMNTLGYDAGTLGNHEFNYGLEFLSSVLEDARFPVVLSNAALQLGATPEQDETYRPPYAILERKVIGADGQSHDLKIGIIGFVPPQVSVWDKQHLENRLYLRGITRAARAHVPMLKAAGADLIIALNHSGIGNPQDIELQENASIPLAAIDGIDVVLCGHQHGRFPSPEYAGIEGVDAVNGTLHGKPAVMAGFWGSDLGVIDLALSKDSNGTWRINRHKSCLCPIPKDPSPAWPQDLDPDHSATLSHIRTTVAATTQPLHSYFAFLGFDLATRTVAMAQLDSARKALGDTDIPILSAAAPFRAGGHAGPDNYTEVPSGPLTLRGIADLYLFPNTMSVVRVTGAQLRDWLERTTAKFHQIVPGQPDQLLLEARFPSYNCDIFLGLDYDIDLSQSPRFSISGDLNSPQTHRIRNLRYNGRPIADNDQFLVATNNYRAGGGGAFAGTPPGELVLATQCDIRAVLIEWLRAQETLDIAPCLNWRFTPVPGASVLLHTAPKAHAYAADLPLAVESTGQMDQGFAVYRMAL